MESSTKLVAIVGETASGKSQLALDLAKKFDGEIICADSWTVYKDFDIGTAKPNLDEQREVRHHLLDIANPPDGFSAAVFKRLAIAAIDDVINRGKLPILVGGSGLYIDSILFDYHFLPAGADGLREELNKLSLEDLLVKIQKDGIDTSGIDDRNKRRLIRLIETGGQRPLRSNLRPYTLILGLQIPPQELEDRITKRVDRMLDLGLENEASLLAQKYGWDAEPMKGIGYREFKAYFAKTQTMPQTRERIIRSTIQLAKKQRTWFRSSRYNQPSVKGSHFLAETGPGLLDMPTGSSRVPKPISSQKLSSPNMTNGHSAMTKRNNSIQWLQNPEQASAIVKKFLSK